MRSFHSCQVSAQHPRPPPRPARPRSPHENVSLESLSLHRRFLRACGGRPGRGSPRQRAPNSGPGAPNSGPGAPNSGPGAPNSGPGAPNSGPRTSNSGLVAPEPTPSAPAALQLAAAQDPPLRRAAGGPGGPMKGRRAGTVEAASAAASGSLCASPCAGDSATVGSASSAGTRPACGSGSVAAGCSCRPAPSVSFTASFTAASTAPKHPASPPAAASSLAPASGWIRTSEAPTVSAPGTSDSPSPSSEADSGGSNPTLSHTAEGALSLDAPTPPAAPETASQLMAAVPLTISMAAPPATLPLGTPAASAGDGVGKDVGAVSAAGSSGGVQRTSSVRVFQ
eukprot:scaffold3382_cov108-Isochrysis_galbana.AAC.10